MIKMLGTERVINNIDRSIDLAPLSRSGIQFELLVAMQTDEDSAEGVNGLIAFQVHSHLISCDEAFTHHLSRTLS